MAVTDVTLEKLDPAEVTDKERTYRATYRVTTDNVMDSISIIADTRLPRLYSHYRMLGSVDPYAIVKRFNATMDEGTPYLWHVEVQWDTSREKVDLPKQNPLERAPEVSVETVEGKTPTHRAYERYDPLSDDFIDRINWREEVGFGPRIQGPMVVNSCGELFDPAYETESGEHQITFVRNELNFNWLTFQLYSYTINQYEWYGLGRHQVLMLKPSGQRQLETFENGTYLAYWKVTYKFRVRTPDWHHRPLDQGYSKRNSYGKLVPITDESGRPVSTPRLLDGRGNLLYPNGYDPEKRPVYLGPFRMYPESDFHQLGLY